MDHRAPAFSALQAGILEGNSCSRLFFGFDRRFAGGEGFLPLPRGERKARLKELLETRTKGKAKLIRYVEHFETGGDAILQSASKL